MAHSFRSRVLVLSLAAGLTSLGAVACGGSSESDSENGGSSGGRATACANDTRKDVYVAGLAKQAGTLSLKLVDALPAPPTKGTNTLTLEVLDASGKPVDGATIIVTPFMPDHGHGSAVTPVVTGKGGGKYEISKVYLAMAGLWTLTFSVQVPGAPATQEAAFAFCLDG